MFGTPSRLYCDSMRTIPSPLLLALALFISAAVSNACQRQPQQEPQPQPAYVPTATIKDLMLGVIDPNADVVWNSVVTIATAKGIEDHMPANDEEWAKVRHGALTLAEGANLLMMPGRRVARPGEKSETPGVELEPEEMQANIEKDRQTWNRMALDLQQATLGGLKAIEARDREGIMAAGETIDNACEACHSHYWYPNQPLPPALIESQKAAP